MKLITHIDFYSAERSANGLIDIKPEPLAEHWEVCVDWNSIKDVLPGEYHETYAARISDGHKCVLCRSGDSVVHTSWLAVERLIVDEIRFEWCLPHDSVCIYDVNTMPAARGRGYYTKTLRWLRVTELLNGITNLWIYADAGNTNSSRGIMSAGFTLRSRVTAVSFGHRILFSVGSKPDVK